MEKQNIGEIISSNRRQKRMTQRELADMLNVTDKAVSKWERNIARPDINTIPKLAEILDVPVEDLINIPVSRRNKEEPANEDPITVAPNAKCSQNGEENAEAYKERVRRLLIKGLIGFVGGFLVAQISAVSDKESLNLTFGILIGIGMAGVPYGWELMEWLFGRWSAVGHIGMMILFFFFKLVAATLIGWIAYPIALLYNAIRAQKRGSKLKIVFAIILIAVIFCLLILFGVIKLGGGDPGSSDVPIVSDNTAGMHVDDVFIEETVAVEADQYIMDETIIISSDLFADIIDKADGYVRKKENEARESNFEIVMPSSLKAAYFLSGTDLEYGYYDFGTGTSVMNAILVVGHYNVNIANTSPRDEWVLSVFPNFEIDAGGNPSYDQDGVYCEYLQANSLQDVYTWMSKEYEGMTIVLLDVPLN